MKLRIQALHSLRWNYRWKGVWFWLKDYQCCRECNATGYVLGPSGDLPLATIRCRGCDAQIFVRGWRRILVEPERVIAEQSAVAEGVFG